MCISSIANSKRLLVRNHRLDRRELDDVRRLDHRRDQRSRDIGRHQFTSLGGAFRRKAVESQFAQPVIKPFVVGQLGGINA